jgi:hypothetical protein
MTCQPLNCRRRPNNRPQRLPLSTSHLAASNFRPTKRRRRPNNQPRLARPTSHPAASNFRPTKRRRRLNNQPSRPARPTSYLAVLSFRPTKRRRRPNHCRPPGRFRRQSRRLSNDRRIVAANLSLNPAARQPRRNRKHQPLGLNRHP